MEIFDKHPQYKHVLEVCKKLHAAGFKAWLAGGCVRDAILQIAPKDFDVATSATPKDVQRLFPNSLDIGKQFGIIMVQFDGFQVEVATFRTDGIYKDGRRPTEVTFSTPEEDAKRRDFTINAMFFDPIEKKIYDFTDGKKDLAAKLIKAVGDANKRFEEDKLRMLRAVRFAAQLDFTIEAETLKAIQKKRREVLVVSKERIYQELHKMFISNALMRGLKYLRETHLHEILFENFKNFGDFENRYEKSLHLLKNLKNLDEVTRWTLFFHPFFENTFNSLGAIENFMQEFKFPSQMIKTLHHHYERTKWMETFMSHRDGEVLEFIFSSEGKSFMNFYAELSHDAQDLQKIQRILALKTKWQVLPAPLVDGNDLINLGMIPGTEFKKNLKNIYYHQLENKITNKQELLAWTKEQKL